MNRKFVDSLWLTALLSACALGFYPAQAALAEPPAAQTPMPETTSALRRRPAPRRLARAKLVNHEFVNTDVVFVIKVLAKEMGRNVYIGPDVEGSVTINLRSVPADGALALVLQDRGIGYKLIGYNTLIVARPDRVDLIEDQILGKSMGPSRPRGIIRQEVLVENAPAARVITSLQARFKDVEFIPHPTLNGFYAVGSRSDILELKNLVPDLDIECK